MSQLPSECEGREAAVEAVKSQEGHDVKLQDDSSSSMDAKTEEVPTTTGSLPEDPAPQSGPAPNLESEITTEQLKEALEEFVTPETVKSLTRRIVRTKIEEKFDLPAGSTESRKKEINALLQDVIDRFAQESKNKRRYSSVEHDSSGAHASGGEDEEGSGGEGASEDEAGTSRSKKARKGGVKKAQSDLMTRTHFRENAQPLETSLGTLQFTVTPREFSTGSCGWFYGSKHEFTVGQEKVTCQLTINCTVLGSKFWKP